ncbi:class I SAM-dependent methyltransferase, partial [Patescibacteria group bacterium]|nr:class I SAM-dependent methyltransferase [Patescibacteria group bacterium]
LYNYYKFIEQLINNKNYKNSLEFGCGRGTTSLYLRIYKNFDVTLSDISPSAIELAKKNFEMYGAKADFLVGDCQAVPLPDNGFDVIVSIGLLEHFENYAAILVEKFRLLKPGGVMISLNIPGKPSVQCLNNVYRKFLRAFGTKKELKKDYFRNNDKPEDYMRAAKRAGFADCFTLDVNPFPLFTPLPLKIDKILTYLYRAAIKIRSVFMKYPFKTNSLLAQAHFLVGYKK